MSKLLTTLQVRNIMLKNGVYGNSMYTNKTSKNPGNIRRVKCYRMAGDGALIAALREAAGAENVNLTPGGECHRSGGPGITVKCVLE